MDVEFDRMCSGALMVLVEMLSCHLPVRTEENPKTSR
jgi:hypothetical protein